MLHRSLQCSRRAASHSALAITRPHLFTPSILHHHRHTLTSLHTDTTTHHRRHRTAKVNTDKHNNPINLNASTDLPYVAQPSGKLGTKNYRIYFYPDEAAAKAVSGHSISPWHDIPYKHTDKDGTVQYTYVQEIPVGTVDKYEIATKELKNPIAQDIKKGELRTFKYGQIGFNYGAITQTWEDPHHDDEHTHLPGDNDPLDVVEISGDKLPVGSVHRVKVLGILCLIDEGETDWKVLAVHNKSKLYSKLNSHTDIDSSVIDKVKDWFIKYKTADGKPENKLGMDGQVQDSQFAVNIIEQCHKHWFDLVNKINHTDGLALKHQHAKGPL